MLYIIKLKVFICQMSDASRARGRKATKKSAAAGSEEQLAQNAQEQQQAPRGRDAPRVDNQHVQPEMVAAITQEVMRQLEARPQRERSRGRSKSKKCKKRRRRDRSPSRSSSESDSDSSGTSTCRSDNSDSDEPDSDGDQTPKLISSPIASQVESKLKNKIWQDKYVDFAKLLPLREENDDNDGFQIQSAGKSDFKILKTKKKGQIRNIEQWTNAFLRFVEIYSIKHPKKEPNVLKHGEIVRDLASRKIGSAWLVYDQQVRRDMKVRSIPWGQLHYEYWVMATTAKPYGGGNQSDQPIRASILEKFLEDYDQSSSKFLVEGISQGFHLNFEGSRKFRVSKNLLSAHKNHKVVNEKLQKEIALGRIIGPFSTPPIQNLL